jgi:hypothetical protein
MKLNVQMEQASWQALLDVLSNAPAPLRITMPIVQDIVNQLNAHAAAEAQAAQQQAAEPK